MRRRHLFLSSLLVCAALPAAAPCAPAAWREQHARAEIARGQALAAAGRLRDAADTLDHVLEDRWLPAAVRADAAAALGEALLPASPAGALRVLEEAEAISGADTPAVEAALAHALLVLGRTGDLARRLERISVLPGDEASACTLLAQAAAWSGRGDADRIRALAERVQARWPYPTPAIAAALASARSAAAAGELRADLAGLVARLQAEGTRPPAGLAALAEIPATGDFAARLWDQTVQADQSEVAGGPALCDRLLTLCDRLPSGSPYRFESLFLRARRCRRRGDRKAEQAVLLSIVQPAGGDSDVVPPAYLAPACRELGASFEATGSWNDALAVYRRAEPLVAAYASSCDCLLHAVLIDLEQEQDADAVRLIRLLESASASAPRSACAEEIGALIALVRTGKHAECWRAARSAWKGWLELARGEGVAADRLPAFEHIRQFENEASAAAQAGERGAFFEHYLLLASGARWLPSLAPEVAALEPAAAKLSAQSAADWRGAVISLLACPHPDSLPYARERQVYLASNYYNGRRLEEARRTITDFFRREQPDDAVTRTMHQLQDLSGATPEPEAPALPVLPSSSASAFAHWRASAGLDWFDLCEPADLAGFSAAGLIAALRDPSRYPLPGQVKLRLLAAEDPRLGEESRRSAFRSGVRQLVTLAPDVPSLERVARGVVEAPDLDLETRIDVYWSTLVLLAQEGRTAAYRRWRANPLASELDAGARRKLATLDFEASLDRAEPAAVAKAARSLAAGSLDTYGLLAEADLFGVLLRRGDLADAEVLAADSSRWRLDADARDALPQVQLEFSRRLGLVRALQPVHEAMAGRLLAALPAGSVRPRQFEDLRPDGHLPAWHSPEALAAARDLAVRRDFAREDLGFWQAVVAALSASPHGAEITARLFRAGLAAAGDDALRSELAAIFLGGGDVDDAAARGALEAAIEPFTGEGNPRTDFVFRLYAIERDLRLGRAVSIDAAFADLADPRAEVVRERTALRAFTASADAPALRRALAGIDAARLLSPSFLPSTIRAYRSLGDEAALPPLLAEARRQLRDAVLESWVLRDDAAGDRALDLAEAIGDASLPSGWVRDVGSGCGDPLLQGRLHVLAHVLAGDWRDAERDAARLNREFPGRYRFFWHRAIALHHLGRDQDAAQALAVFARFARDDPDYPAAEALLRRLRSVTIPPAG